MWMEVFATSSFCFINETGAIWFASLWEFFEKRIVLGHRVTDKCVWRLSLKLRRQIWFMHRNAQISLTFNTMKRSPRTRHRNSRFVISQCFNRRREMVTDHGFHHRHVISVFVICTRQKHTWLVFHNNKTQASFIDFSLAPQMKTSKRHPIVLVRG